MEHNGNENLTSPSPTPTLCTNGCGYYGNSAFDGMCSMCFKDTLKRRQQNASPVCLIQQTASQQNEVTNVSQPAVSAEQTCTDITVSKDAPAISLAPPAVQALATSSSAASIVSDTDSAATNSDGSDSEKNRKPRCLICKKKVGLTGFECRCGGLFCSKHRYSDMHDCQFDYKQQAQDELRKSNPLVTGEKIRKI